MSGRLRQSIGVLLHVPDTPHRTALAFGIGVWIAFFPVLGIHTLMALAIAFGFRLSRVAMLLGVYLNNPWTLAPLYAAGTAVGCVLLGESPREAFREVDWHAGMRALLESLRPLLWPYVLGNTVLGLLGGAAGYWALRRTLERRTAR